MLFTRLNQQCYTSVNVKAKCVSGYALCAWRSITTKESKRIAMRWKRELEPEGTMSLRRECDRLSKARCGALESEFYHKHRFVNMGKVGTTVLFICLFSNCINGEHSGGIGQWRGIYTSLFILHVCTVNMDLYMCKYSVLISVLSKNELRCTCVH